MKDFIGKIEICKQNYNFRYVMKYRMTNYSFQKFLVNNRF